MTNTTGTESSHIFAAGERPVESWAPDVRSKRQTLSSQLSALSSQLTALGLPATTERLVQRHHAAIQLHFRLRLGILGGQPLALGVQQHEEIHRAFAVAD